MSHGADVNATVYSIYSEVRLDIALEESPWSYLERSVQFNADRSTSFRDFLQPLSAHSRRSWRFIHLLELDAVEYYPEQARTWCASENWYTLSQEQSNTLNNKWPHTFRGYGDFKIATQQIKASIENAKPAVVVDVELRRGLDLSKDDSETDF